MPHSDPELIALYALGEPIDPADAAHIDDCDVCGEDAAALRRVVEASIDHLGEGAGVELGLLTPEAPPRSVWEAIARETSIDPNLLPYTHAPTQGAPASRPAEPVAASAPVVELADRRTRRGSASRMWLVAAAVALLGIGAGVGGTLVWQAQDDSTAQVTATVPLDPLGTRGLTGAAEVVTASDNREIVVRIDRSAAAPGFLEVWLLSADASSMVSLGVLDGDEGTFAVPADLDLSAYPLVDVSIEPYDGNPAHSGDSVCRGDLDAA